MIELTERFDDTLTPEEREAPTFLEWGDTTLARGVRTLAVSIRDFDGFPACTGMAAAIILEKLARDSNEENVSITLDGGTLITVRGAGLNKRAEPPETPAVQPPEHDSEKVT